MPDGLTATRRARDRLPRLENTRWQASNSRRGVHLRLALPEIRAVNYILPGRIGQRTNALNVYLVP